MTLGEAILKIITDPAYCAQLGQGNPDLVADDSEEVTFRRYEELYSALVALA